MVRGGAFKPENSNCKDPEAGELDVRQDGKEVAHAEQTEGAGNLRGRGGQRWRQ